MTPVRCLSLSAATARAGAIGSLAGSAAAASGVLRTGHLWTGSPGHAAGGRHQFGGMLTAAGRARHRPIAAHDQYFSGVIAIPALNFINRHIYPPFESVSMLDSALAPAALLP
jgi:hypothetical protein